MTKLGVNLGLMYDDRVDRLDEGIISYLISKNVKLWGVLSTSDLDYNNETLIGLGYSVKF